MARLAGTRPQVTRVAAAESCSAPLRGAELRSVLHRETLSKRRVPAISALAAALRNGVLRRSPGRPAGVTDDAGEPRMRVATAPRRRGRGRRPASAARPRCPRVRHGAFANAGAGELFERSASAPPAPLMRERVFAGRPWGRGCAVPPWEPPAREDQTAGALRPRQSGAWSAGSTGWSVTPATELRAVPWRLATPRRLPTWWRVQRSGFSYTVTPRSRRPTMAKPRRSQNCFASTFSSTTDRRRAR